MASEGHGDDENDGHGGEGEHGDDDENIAPAAANRARIERAVRDESLLFDTVTGRSFVAECTAAGNVFVIFGNGATKSGGK